MDKKTNIVMPLIDFYEYYLSGMWWLKWKS